MTLATRRTPHAGFTTTPPPAPAPRAGAPAAGATFGGPRRYDRQPGGEPLAYGRYTIAPMRETLLGDDQTPGAVRTRWDILETLRVPGHPPLITRRKTCASRISAEGWVDAFGDACAEACPESVREHAGAAAAEAERPQPAAPVQ